MVEKEKTSPTAVDKTPPPDIPPKRERKKRGPNKVKWAKAEMVRASLQNYFKGVTGVVRWINPADGEILATGADDVIKELVELGRVDRNVKNVLEKLATPGKYGPLILAVSPMLIALAANHNLIPQLKIDKPMDNIHPISEVSANGQ